MARILVQGQKELSAFDISMYFEEYRGPPEGIELILSEYPAQYDKYSTDDGYGPMYPALAAILSAYGRDPSWESNLPSSWESTLRVCLRRGADLHAPVRRSRFDMSQVGYPCEMAEYGTPLDELFRFNKDSSASRRAADGWLRILASEGHNVSLYLETEWNWRARDMHFTHASTSAIGYDSPRKLYFELGDRPSVYWDWWIDPASSTSLLREEFKCLVTTSPDWLMIRKPWKESWPFVYPKAKAARARPLHIPGAWPL